MSGGRATREALFRRGVDALRNAGVQNPALDAAVLLGHVSGEPAASVLLERGVALAGREAERYRDLIRRRCARLPLSRILGRREFYSRDFAITGDVLDPRPETELLVEVALKALEGRPGISRVLDVGTGSGAIAVTVAAENPKVRVVATDISMAALRVARKNAVTHGTGNRTSFVRADLGGGLGGGVSFELILSNPPYISPSEYRDLPEEVRCSDPPLALLAGPEGTEFYGPLARLAARCLVPGGSLVVEVGAGQGDAVARILEGAGLVQVHVIPDLEGRGRVVKGDRPHA